MSENSNASVIRPMVMEDADLISDLCRKYKNSLFSRFRLTIRSYIVLLTVSWWIYRVNKDIEDLYLYEEAKEAAKESREVLVNILDEVKETGCNKIIVNNICKSVDDLDEYILEIELFLDDDIHELARKIVSFKKGGDNTDVQKEEQEKQKGAFRNNKS